MERLQSIDLLKIIAMFGVISLHSTMLYITPGATGLADIVYDMGVISVPLFFMVSGFFLIPRRRTMKYCLMKSLKYIRFIVSMVLLFWVGYSLFFGLDVALLVKWLTGTLLTHGPFGVFWYLWAVILCLLITPLLNSLFSSHSRLYTALLLALWLLCTLIFSNTMQGGLFEARIPALAKVYAWFFFYMLGGELSRRDVPRIPVAIPLLLFAFAIFYMEYCGRRVGSEYASVFYLSVPVTVLCIVLFLYFKGLNIIGNKAVQALSQTFLPVYAVHNVIIQFLPRFYDGLCIAPLINWVVISLLSVAFGLVVNKLPYVNKLFKA